MPRTLPFSGVRGYGSVRCKSSSSLTLSRQVYQEQMLSRCVLYYNSGGISWHCVTAKASETDPGLGECIDDFSSFQRHFLHGPHGVIQSPSEGEGRVASGQSPSKWLLRFGRKSSSGVKVSETETADETARQSDDWLPAWNGAVSGVFQYGYNTYDADTITKSGWQNIVESYMGRVLSHQTDRLAAILGIAGTIKGTTKDPFWAGLWQSTAHSDLLWSVRHGTDLDKARPQSLIAPSWSWASVNAPVQYPDRLDGMHKSLAGLRVELSGTASRQAGLLLAKGTVRQASLADNGTRLLAKCVAGLESSKSYPEFFRRPITKLRWFPDEKLADGTALTLAEVAITFTDDVKIFPPRCKDVYHIALVPSPTQDRKGRMLYKRVGLAITPHSISSKTYQSLEWSSLSQVVVEGSIPSPPYLHPLSESKRRFLEQQGTIMVDEDAYWYEEFGRFRKDSSVYGTELRIA